MVDDPWWAASTRAERSLGTEVVGIGRAATEAAVETLKQQKGPLMGAKKNEGDI
jgi:hypothetical protein